MKRIPALPLALLLLTSCGGTAEVEETAADETAPQETETETVWEPLAHLPEDQLDGASFTFLGDGYRIFRHTGYSAGRIEW